MKRGKIVACILVVLFSLTSTSFAAFSASGLDEGRFNDFKGTIDGKYKIRMLLYAANNEIVGNYFYELYESKIKLTGRYEGKLITLFEYDDQGNQTARFSGEIIDAYGRMKGVWQNLEDNASYDFELKMLGTFPGRPDNVYIDAGARSTDEVERFAAKLKNDILSRNKNEVAAEVAYPIIVYAKGQKVTINSEQEFIEQFGEIFYPEYVQAIAKCFPVNMHSSYRGIMFGDKGQIWLNYLIFDKSSVKLMVTGINNHPEDVTYFLKD
ncbi:MAG TPA: hypothetical protein PKA10_15060 [Selenomonadales bacterium]|nr:hypothetical protein [Selenomonadales bacterium]